MGAVNAANRDSSDVIRQRGSMAATSAALPNAPFST